jgi:5-methylcytosine-specific restriction endonuclease McrA
VSRFRGAYPKDWKTLSDQVREEAGWRCIRCGHPHDRKAGYTLTVHHLDNDKSNTRWWNLAALCQRCHLHIQGKVHMERMWMFEHSEWFKPYVAGYYASRAGLPDDRESVTRRLEEYLALGQVVIP